MWGPVAEQRLVPKQTSWDIFKSGAEVAGHRCHPLLSSLTHEQTFHILWITPVGSAAGEAKGIISREWDWDKAVKEGRSGTDRLSGRLHLVHLQLCHLRPWILLFSPFFQALNPCLSCLAQTALRLISSWQGSALGTHTCPFFWSSQSHDSWSPEMSSNFSRVYPAPKCQDQVCNPDILAPDCGLNQQLILGPQVFLLVPKLAFDQRSQGNNWSSPSGVFEYICGHFLKTAATFKYNYQYVETKDIEKHTEVHVWKQTSQFGTC